MIERGLLQPERSLRETQKQRSTQALESANSLLSWLHSHVAEDLAESARVSSEGAASSSKQPPPSRSPLPKLNTGVFLDFLDERGQGVRWMPPGTSLAEMHDLARTFLPHLPVTYGTFVKCYHMGWAKKLKIRAEGQRSKCSVCERLKEYRRQVTAPEDAKRVSEEYAAHLQEMMRNRTVDHEICMEAQISAGATAGSQSPENSVLSIAIDAMDAAKFRVPRNISASKEFQSLWRPELTVVGAITEGLTEHYFFADVDLPKNADMHIAIVGHCLEDARAEFQARGRPFPRHLRLHSDNATSEGKNQTVFYLAAWLAHRLFESVVLTQFGVGHTHFKLDQRFSEIRFALSQCTVLQDPDSFMQAISEGVQPREGRDLKVHRLRAAPHFREFFQQLDLNVSGHTQTKKKTENHEEAVHVFVFQRRDSFQGVVPDDTAECPPEAGDVILTCRQHLSSQELSQAPLLFAGAADFAKLLPGGPSELTPRGSFSDRQKKEFQKTAEKISQPPWNMEQGCAYLLKLLQENADNSADDWQPPSMSWMLNGKSEDGQSLQQVKPVLTGREFQWNHLKPAAVAVARPPAKLRRLKVKQPAVSMDTGHANTAGSAPQNQAAEAAADVLLPPPAGPEEASLPDARGAEPADALPPPATAEASLPDEGEADVLLPPAALSEEEFPLSSLAVPAPAPPNEAREAAGAPAGEYGRNGAPAHVAILRRPAAAQPAVSAAAKATARPEAAAKGRATAKTKAKAQPAPPPNAVENPAGNRNVRRRLGHLPMPANVNLGCPKCRYGSKGCMTCRARAGLVLNADETAWVRRDV